MFGHRKLFIFLLRLPLPPFRGDDDPLPSNPPPLIIISSIFHLPRCLRGECVRRGHSHTVNFHPDSQAEVLYLFREREGQQGRLHL